MAVTKIADVIVPEIFNPYVVQRSTELSEIFASGIVQRTEEFDRLASSSAYTVNMPYWGDLSGADEVLSDATPLTPDKIAAKKDVAVILRRGRAWGANDLAANLAGDDPMRAIADLVAAYWARRYQAALISTLDGVFGAASMSALVHDISEQEGLEGVISPASTVDAIQKLGDAKGNLTAIVMHSATEAALAKQSLIVYLPAEDRQTDRIPTYLGKRVIVDDGCPVASGGVYTTYLFGSGAVAYGSGSPVGFVPTETERAALAGEDRLINRQTFILHVRGVAWTPQEDIPKGSSPDNAELADGGNWTRRYDAKALRVVKFVHLIGAPEPEEPPEEPESPNGGNGNGDGEPE